jgi:hypothetical protein
VPGFPRHAHYSNLYGEDTVVAGVGMHAGADVYSQPSGEGKASMRTPAAWAQFWFWVSLAYLILIYTGMFTVNH